MKGKGIGIIILVLALMAFLVGCSADALQKSGESMGNIGKKAGMGKAGESLVNEAVESIDAFVANYEYCFKFYEPIFNEGKASSVTVKNEKSDGYDGEKALRELAASIVSEIAKATESSASDKAIKEALAKPYPETGITYAGQVFRKLGDALSGSLTGSGVLSMMAMLATMDGINLPEGLFENIQKYVVPIPIRAHDLLQILENQIYPLASHILELVMYNKAHPKPEPEPKPSGSVDTAALLAIPESIAANTGDRTYQTVGDKICVALLFDVTAAANAVFKNYEETHKDPNDDVDYSEFGFEWIIANCGGLLDRVVADINTIGYINGTHIDAAGIIGSYVSSL